MAAKQKRSTSTKMESKMVIDDSFMQEQQIESIPETEYKFENLEFHYTSGVKLIEDPGYSVEVFHFSKLTTGQIRSSDMERALRNMQINKSGERKDSQDMRKYTREVEHEWIQAVQTATVNNGNLILGHSHDDLTLETLTLRLNSHEWIQAKINGDTRTYEEVTANGSSPLTKEDMEYLKKGIVL